MNSISGDSSRAIASIGGARSSPVTLAPALVSARESAPVPQATSSTRMPADGCRWATMRTVKASNIPGTR